MKYSQVLLDWQWFLRITLIPTIDTCNTPNPVHSVAIVCHQGRCMRWGQQSPFHAASSLVCMGYITNSFGQNLPTCFLRRCNLGHTGMYVYWSYCSFDTESYYFGVCVYQRSPQNSAEIYRNMIICGGFRAMAARENYPGFILLTHRANYLDISVGPLACMAFKVIAETRQK